MKEEDENKRGGHAQALKFYNNEWLNLLSNLKMNDLYW
jgi:hypothetical protein